MARKRRLTAAPREQATPATPDFAQHHDVDARQDRAGGIAGWRVKTRLDALLGDGTIGAAEWQAGDNYRRDFEVGELGGRLAEVGSGSGGGGGCPTTARLDALGRLGSARNMLTPEQRTAMDALAADMSWPTLGLRLCCGKDAARTTAVAALKVLAGHYKLHGKAGRIRALHAA